MTFGKWKSLAAAAGLAVIAAAGSTSSASAACLSLSYVDVGCFSSPALQIGNVGGAPDNFIGAKTNSTTASLVFANSSFGINYITFQVGTLSPNHPFTLSLVGFLQQGTNSESVNVTGNAAGGAQTFSFYSVAAGGETSLNFFFNAADGPTAGAIGHIVAQAPAPIPGAGFLSFLSVAFAGMWRRGRSMASRVLRRRVVATA